MEFEMLAELLEQNQFEIADEEVLKEYADAANGKHERRDIRIVYLMNDAAESFLVLRNCIMTGRYIPEYEGEMGAEFRQTQDDNILILRQGENVVSFFFSGLEKEIHLYNYARLGHFWVKGYEYLRRLEYHLAILRDKRDYLGEAYCNAEELELAVLTEFPPLNYCCYPSASPQWVVPAYPEWKVSKEAIREMKMLAREAGNQGMERLIGIYGRFPTKFLAKRIAYLLHRESHAALTELIIQKLEKAASEYSDRAFDSPESNEDGVSAAQRALRNAKERKAELETAGYRVNLVFEEPFTTSRDGVGLKYHLMVHKYEKGDHITEIETF